MAGLGKVEVGLFDLAQGTTLWTLAEGTTVFARHCAGLADGHAYRVLARATDREGNVESSSATLHITVDLPPVTRVDQDEPPRLRFDQILAPSGNVDLRGGGAVRVPSPTFGSSAATKAYVDAAIAAAIDALP